MQRKLFTRRKIFYFWYQQSSFALLFQFQDITIILTVLNFLTMPINCISLNYYTDFECRTLCESNSHDCQWFSFFPTINYCELFENCSYIDSRMCQSTVIFIMLLALKEFLQKKINWYFIIAKMKKIWCGIQL